MTIPYIKTLVKELYAGGLSVPCGPDFLYKSYHRNVIEGYSNFIFNAPHLVPDRFYKPDVKIAIDFNHKFTRPDNAGRRPLDIATLRSEATKLARFASYYFDYALSYGKNLDKVRRVTDFDPNDEESISLFLNAMINYFLTQINIDRSVTDIGTCSLELKDNPNYRGGKKFNIFLNKARDILDQLLAPMLPIMVWARGRLYTDWYFPIFDGYITNATYNNAQGFSSVTVNCRDALELARISYEMVNPAIIQLDEFKKREEINIYDMPFYGIDHLEIFDTMFRGGKIIYTSSSGRQLINPDDLSDLPYDEFKKNDSLGFSALGDYVKADEDTAVKPGDLSEVKVIHRNSFSLKKILDKVSYAKRPRYTAAWGYKITPYRIFNFQTPNVFTSEFSDRLSILRDVSEMTYYNMYIDGYGTVHYHPMRLANDYLTYDAIYDIETGGKSNEQRHKHPFPGVQVIGNEEIISQSTNLNVEELVTFLRLSGVFAVEGSAQPELVDLIGSAADTARMGRYGYRRRELKNPLFNQNPELRDFGSGENTDKFVKFMDLAADSLIRYINSELHSRTSTMVFRPEFDIALPAIYPDDNNIYYTQSMSHSITIGGDATTTTNGNFGRKDRHLPPDLASYILITEKLFKTGGKFKPSLGVVNDDNLAEFHELERTGYKIPASNFTNAVVKQAEEEQKYLDAAFDELEREKQEAKKARDAKGDTKKANTKTSRAQKVREAQEEAAEQALAGINTVTDTSVKVEDLLDDMDPKVFNGY